MRRTGRQIWATRSIEAVSGVARANWPRFGQFLATRSGACDRLHGIRARSLRGTIDGAHPEQARRRLGGELALEEGASGTAGGALGARGAELGGCGVLDAQSARLRSRQRRVASRTNGLDRAPETNRCSTLRPLHAISHMPPSTPTPCRRRRSPLEREASKSPRATKPTTATYHQGGAHREGLQFDERCAA
jgi:hypothetical protein